MKKYDKEIAQAQLDNEKAVLKKLESNYKDALEEIDSKIAELMGRADADMQHVVYQVEYQKALKAQTEAILKTLQNNEFETVSAYLTQCYDEGFISTLYAMQKQGVPLVFPINQEEVASAIQLETNLSTSLYEAFDMKDLQKKIAGEISRGFSTGALYSEITRNVASYAQISKNKAMRIVRTEGHRITETAASNAQKKAKDRGADIVKIWDATLDGKTRPSHMRVDGEIREIGKKFSNGLEFPGDPYGKAAEVINCRCRSRSDARWALEADETKMLGDVSEMSEERKKEIAKKLGVPVDTLDQYSNQIVPVKAKDYADFKKQYNQLWRYEGSALQKEAEERIAGYGKSKGFDSAQSMAAETDRIEWPKPGKKITTEQYKEVMRYARDKGIELSGFKNFDGDIRTVTQLVDDAKSVAELYPKINIGKRKMRIELNRSLNSNDFAETRGHVININANAYRDVTRLAEEYNKLAEEGWFVKGTDYHAIIKHEMGHVVANTYNIDVMSVAEKVTGLNGQAAVLDFFEEHLSEYASKYKDGSEIISECFASVYGSTEKNNYALKFVEECDKLIKNNWG